MLQAMKTFAVFTKYGTLARIAPQSFGGLRMSATVPDAMCHLVLLNQLKLARKRLWSMYSLCPSFRYSLPSHVWNSTPSQVTSFAACLSMNPVSQNALAPNSKGLFKDRATFRRGMHVEN